VDVRSFSMMAGVDVARVGGPGAKGHVLQKVLCDHGLNLKSTGKIREALAAA